MLLAKVLLFFDQGCGMSAALYGCRTSNDLLHELMAKHSESEQNYRIVAQCVDDVRNVENAPAVSMGPYLLGSGRGDQLTTISVYSLPGETPQQLRLLYMNGEALRYLERDGKITQDYWFSISSASRSAPCLWRPLQQIRKGR